MNEAAPARILVVDDDDGVRNALSNILSRDGYRMIGAGGEDEALSLFRSQGPDLLLLDLTFDPRRPGEGGMTVLRRVKEADPRVVVVIVTASHESNFAIEAMRLGAFDYITKPWDNKVLKDTVLRALEQRALLVAAERGEVELDLSRNLVGASEAIREIHQIVRRIAPTDGTVLIHGESGTGKELVAHMVHRLSRRANHPFVVVNCGAFPETLLESELFGHVKGAFTGATADRKGLIETAHPGTLFLDEVGELSPATQVKLLRVLQEREFLPVGGTEPRRVDVRFVAATNRDLEKLIADGSFRPDLYYRLNVIPIRVPALRERLVDIPLLAGQFLNKYSQSLGKRVRGFSQAALDALQSGHDWPGNVRELENVVQRAVAFCEDELIGPADLGGRFATSPAPAPASADLALLPPQGVDLEALMERIEKSLLLQALERTKGHLTNAAKLLNLSFRSIRYKVKKYGLKEGKSSE